jgi:glyoxylase I family protein
MENATLHHVSRPTKNMGQAITFYETVLGFKRISRPAFKIGGAWLQAGSVELHLVDFSQGSFRNVVTVGTDDIHLAMRVTDFESVVSHLAKLGYVENLADDDGRRIVIKRNSMAGYHQLYIMDADRHLIEINAAS